MRSKIAVLTFGLSFMISALAYGHANFTGYSGAPGCNGRCASSCHGVNGGTIQVSGFPSQYIPGQAYTISISHSGGSTIKQFNGSCRIGTGSQDAGVISAGTNTATYNTSVETNGIHLSSTDRDNGTFIWTAPSSGTGEVRLYVAGHQGSYSGQNSTISLIATEQSTGIPGDEYAGTPNEFSLKDNYPNPFNAVTTIGYDLPATSHVTIDIFDVLGQKVETIVDAEQQAGYHQISWNANNLPTGIYFYRIQADDFKATKRMLLLK